MTGLGALSWAVCVWCGLVVSVVSCGSERDELGRRVCDYGRFPCTGWLALLCFWTGRVPRRRLTVGRDENKARFSRDRSAAASSRGEGGGHYEVLFASK